MIEQDNSRAIRTSKEDDVAPDQEKDESRIESSEKEQPKYHYSWLFWVIFPALCITGFLSSLEGSLVTTAMPTFYGQLANIFGRRWVTLGEYALFLLGSGIAGGADFANMLIAGRAIQGSGSGCLVMMASQAYEYVNEN